MREYSTVFFYHVDALHNNAHKYFQPSFISLLAKLTEHSYTLFSAWLFCEHCIASPSDHGQQLSERFLDPFPYFWVKENDRKYTNEPSLNSAPKYSFPKGEAKQFKNV